MRRLHWAVLDRKDCLCSLPSAPESVWGLRTFLSPILMEWHRFYSLMYFKHYHIFPLPEWHIVEDWLRAFNVKIKNKIACSLIFLHLGVEFSKLGIVLLPSKTTSVSQPLDHGIIKGINLNFRELMRSVIADTKSASFATELAKPLQSLMQQFV